MAKDLQQVTVDRDSHTLRRNSLRQNRKSNEARGTIYSSTQVTINLFQIQLHSPFICKTKHDDIETMLAFKKHLAQAKFKEVENATHKNTA